ncbi:MULTISPECIES: hypothetical protein [unclassified Caballeronia]|uniref:hypothetical protein n=1 Tax=unclassified Caballeronia TaxID=2646786 RepID=UPI00285FE3E4|nr:MULTISPECIES: hypothetical protein [unclassified Caballeronia]MDR5741061.1 hypothetical protein [Caballeronia sp. LZ016]MDR5806961.1 hypothetical protein [Caballeronia sp. LZ019]
MNDSQATAQSARRRRARVLAAIFMLTCASHAAARTITVISATYGGNCGAPAGNATGDFVRQCDGRDACEYMPERRNIGYSAQSCQSDLQAEWRCSSTESHTATLSAGIDANSRLVLGCVEQNGPGH